MTYTGQFKNDKRHGYGHSKWRSGSVYYGQYKEKNKEGYGFYKWPNGDEYDGEWKDDKRTGVGVYKYAATGKVEKGNYKDSKLIDIIEVIKP
jgi:hypothetical protein